jgi:hypothetical protein
MDNFYAVYNTFYSYSSDTVQDAGSAKTLLGLKPVPPNTVEVIGVFDTVA